MKKQIFYGITFYFENFDHRLDSDLLGEILSARFMSGFNLEGLKRKPLSELFKDSFPFIRFIVLYKVTGRKNRSEREYSVSEYLISKTFYTL